MGVSGLALGLSLGGPSLAQSGCSTYSAYSALASAAGVRTVQSAPGLVFTEGDMGLPEAQAQADSVAGSSGWAGAPYSSTAAGNVGGTGAMNANEVPVFALSSYPAEPETSRSTPVATIEAKSGPHSSTASVVGGGPESDQASAGRVTTSAAASCGDDATVQAVADNVVEMIEIQGVLRIASVRSHAEAAVNPDGQRVLGGTMAVEGATVLGQPVAITDEGVVTGESITPTPDDPLAQALEDAGISVRYVSVVEDTERGQVFAPGLEVVVTRAVQDVGTGPATSTYTLGRAYARAAATQGDQVLPDETPTAPEMPAAPAPPPQEQPPSHDGELAGATAGAPGSSPATPSPDQSAAPVAPAVSPDPLGTPTPASRIANASLAVVYTAGGAGALLLLAAWLLFEGLGARVRWR